MTERGWTSHDLALVGEDERLWTVEDAVRLLGPPQLTTVQVRQFISIMIAWGCLQPVGVRRPDRAERRGRSARVYRAIDVIQLFDQFSEAA